MRHLNLHSINPCQPLGHALGEVHGTVLPSRAAEGDLKVLAAGVKCCQCGNVANSNVANCQYSMRPCILHWKLELTTGNISTLATLSAPGIAAQRFIPVRIRHRPAVEDEAPFVAGLVLRQPALERKRYDGYFHRFATFPFRLLTLLLSSASIAMASSRRSCSLSGKYS